MIAELACSMGNMPGVWSLESGELECWSAGVAVVRSFFILALELTMMNILC